MVYRYGASRKMQRVKLMYFKKIYYIIFLIFLCFLNSIKATKFIDFEQFDFPSERRQGVRVSLVDIDTQKFEGIFYCQNRSFWPWDAVSLSFSDKGDVQLYDNFGFDKYFIRTFGMIKLSKQEFLPRVVPHDYRTMYFPYTEKKDANRITEFFKAFTADIRKPLFYCFICLGEANAEPRDFSTLIQNQQVANNWERRTLGELITELTMISFGYKRLSSQNTSDQGFDGVWTDDLTTPRFLFISESKCRNEEKSATLVMQEELDERNIHKRLRSEDIPVHTRKFVEDFIKTKQPIYKLVSRLKINGQVQACINDFDFFKYQFLTLAVESSESDKIDVLRSFIFKLGVSEEEMTDLVHKAYQFLPEDRTQNTALTNFVNPHQNFHSPLLRNNINFSFPLPTEEENIEALSEQFSTALVIPNLSHSVTPEYSLFRTYSEPKLTKLTELIVNDSNITGLGYKGVSQAKLADFCKISRTPIKKILGKRDGNLTNPRAIWNAITTRFNELCEKNNLPKETIINACTIDPVFKDTNN